MLEVFVLGSYCQGEVSSHEVFVHGSFCPFTVLQVCHSCLQLGFEICMGQTLVEKATCGCLWTTSTCSMEKDLKPRT